MYVLNENNIDNDISVRNTEYGDLLIFCNKCGGECDYATIADFFFHAVYKIQCKNCGLEITRTIADVLTTTEERAIMEAKS